MEHIKQNKTNNCGQTCVQMVTGKPLEEIYKIIEKRGRTNGSDLISTFGKFGYSTTEKMIRWPKELGESIKEKDYCHQTFLCKVYIDFKKSHWVVIDKGFVYDPAVEKEYGIREYFKSIETLKMRITSYAVILGN